MKVLIADKVSSQMVADLKALGCDVTLKPELDAETLPGAVAGAEVLIVRSTQVTAACIDAGTDLSLIIRAGAGVNTIDIKRASEKGVYVANCPGKNTDAVAELAIGLMIATDRRIPDALADLRAGKWRKKEYGKARGLKGRTLGVVGLGHIGEAVACRAQGLGMKVIGWSRSLTPAKAEALDIGFCSSLNELAESADVVSLHLALSKETRGIIGSDFLARMKAGALLVNTARSEIVDLAALKEALRSGRIRAALDVFDNEPSSGEAPFADAEFAGLLAAATPHIGASTEQAEEAIAEETVRIVRTFVETGKPVNAVNPRKAHTGVPLVVRHYNRVGVLAGVLHELRNEGINIEEMDNTIFEGEQAACCSLVLDRRPSDSLLQRIASGENVIQAVLK
ncbi:3-phosphoglycerate dehydrogenase family protein [Propionivibrio soli]|uniref:3-phosphoglycerate dehydrogenase family protein n=1 Tax=Propionivibrio soli TaxID=2976531 RepID=UPI0021E7DD63|nr:3-phosphoglycerate dehydrogenase family protein [Propionivibrio soli]